MTTILRQMWVNHEVLTHLLRKFNICGCLLRSLAVQNSSIIGDLVTDPLTHSLSHFCFLTLKSDPTELTPLRHLITVMRKHDLTNILTIFFENFDNFFDNFQQVYNVDNFRQFWQFLKVWIIFESFDIFDNFWEFWQYWQFLTIFPIF